MLLECCLSPIGQRPCAGIQAVPAPVSSDDIYDHVSHSMLAIVETSDKRQSKRDYRKDIPNEDDYSFADPNNRWLKKRMSDRVCDSALAPKQLDVFW